MPSDKLKSQHHSTGDWDYEQGAAYRSLASDYYISAPTSLKYTGVTPDSVGFTTLCRHPDTLLLPQGEVRSWCRANTVFGYGFTFRNQAALGSANRDNSYTLYAAGTVLRLWRFIGGGLHTVGDIPFAPSINTWYHLRVFWYNGKTPGNADAICVAAYQEIAGEWVQLPPTLYDTLNAFKDSSINRCGLYATKYGTHYRWFDDTEIWGPV